LYAKFPSGTLIVKLPICPLSMLYTYTVVDMASVGSIIAYMSKRRHVSSTMGYIRTNPSMTMTY